MCAAVFAHRADMQSAPRSRAAVRGSCRAAAIRQQVYRFHGHTVAAAELASTPLATAGEVACASSSTRWRRAVVEDAVVHEDAACLARAADDDTLSNH